VTDLTLRSWREIAEDAGFRAPVWSGRIWPFSLVWVVGSLVALLVGGVTEPAARMDIAVLLSVVLFQPVIEELLFRGVVQGYLLRTSLGSWSVHGITFANGLATILFVAAHFVNQAPIWAMGVLLPSLVFGYFRDRTGSVLAPIVLHVSFNAMFLFGGILIQ